MASKYTIDDMRSTAEQRGGSCVSTEYEGYLGELTWRCAQGHEWRSAPANVLRGSWCRECAVQRLRAGVTIADMQAVAAKRGGACLSTAIQSTKDQLRWRCEKGHEWNAVAKNVMYNNAWCKQCARENTLRYTISDMHDLAASRGGACLSTAYRTVKDRLTWRCAEGHEWEASVNGVIAGKWCRLCGLNSRNRKYTIDDMREVAAKHGGECLSEACSTTNDRLRWRCTNGHEWEAAVSSIVGGTWCKACAYKNMPSKYSIADMREIAEKQGGRCLSLKFESVNKPMRWRCSEGHEWLSAANTVIAGHWCQTCANTARRKYTMGMLRDIAKRKLGSVLSGEEISDGTPISSQHKYAFRCFDGHEWVTKASIVLRGGWCRQCADEEMRIGKTALTVVRGMATDVQSAPLVKRRTDVLVDVMKSLSDADMPTLATPIFDATPKQKT